MVAAEMAYERAIKLLNGAGDSPKVGTEASAAAAPGAAPGAVPSAVPGAEGVHSLQSALLKEMQQMNRLLRPVAKKALRDLGESFSDLEDDNQSDEEMEDIED